MLKSSVLILMMLQMENNSLRIINKLRLSIEFRTCLIYLKWSLGFSTPTVPPLWFGAKMLPDFGGVTSLSFSSAISTIIGDVNMTHQCGEPFEILTNKPNDSMGDLPGGVKIPTVKTFEKRPAKEIKIFRRCWEFLYIDAIQLAKLSHKSIQLEDVFLPNDHSTVDGQNPAGFTRPL